MTDCIVVGGGLIGMLTARMLREAGAGVMLVERSELGREASWAGGGILSPLYPWRYPEPVTTLSRYSQARYRDFAESLREETGIDPEWTPSGLLILDVEEQDAALDWARRSGADLRPVGRDAIRDCEPALSAALEAGLWMPAIAQVRNPRLVKALRASLAQRGVVCRTDTPVERVGVRGGRAVGVETAEGPIEGDRVVVATGAWSAHLVPGVADGLPIEPVRGQMILFKTEPGTVSRIVLHQSQYLIPRRDGRVLAGSTLERVGFDKSTTEEAAEDLRRAAIALVPALEHAPIEQHWAGLRPGSPTGVPFIGAHPQIEGLFANAGHFRNGVVMGLASAQLMADLVLDREPALDPEPFRLERDAD
jgi:glycine oxidase